jgi:hypothetical protein
MGSEEINQIRRFLLSIFALRRTGVLDFGTMRLIV